MRPDTRYARSGGLYIGYQVFGTGSADLAVIDQWFGNVDAQWDLEPLADFLERLGSFSRVIASDKRGTGISDPVALDALPTLEDWMDDLRAVLDTVGSNRTIILAGIGASMMALLFAATYPERTAGLILVDAYARPTAAPGYAIGAPADDVAQLLERVGSLWGTRGGLLNFLAPGLLVDRGVAEAYERFERQSASPGAAVAMLSRLYGSDVRHVLPAIRVPTLVIARASGARISADHGRYIASGVPGARFVEIAGSENLMWAGDSQAILAEIQEFVTGVRPEPDVDRVLATVLFTDIVDSTRRAGELGDRGWRTALQEHDRVVRDALRRFRGREIKTTGDGFLATFDGPARAVRCAAAIRDALDSVGLAVRSGLHTGEVELLGSDVGGIAVHIAARICALADGGQILASSTVRDLVAGSGINFDDRGTHVLKGVPGEWRLFAVSI